MQYGHFDDQQREYVITQPDTPLPWINYLGCESYFGLISNTAGGYSFYRDARLRRLTRYRYNNAPFDFGGRYLYIRDNDTGKFWSPSWQPTRTKLDKYECRHGMGYTTISSSCNKIEAQTTYFVPLGETLEIWKFSVTNRRSKPAKLSAFFQHRVLPLGRAGRRDQLPAQLQHRPGRDCGRSHLPQDRVSRAAQPLRVFRLLGKTRRFRYATRHVPRRLPQLWTSPARLGSTRASRFGEGPSGVPVRTTGAPGASEWKDPLSKRGRRYSGFSSRTSPRPARTPASILARSPTTIWNGSHPIHLFPTSRRYRAQSYFL